MKDEPQSGPFQTGERCAEDTSQSVPIQVPGARASTFTGASTFHSLMRSLFNCRCRLGPFAKSFAAQRFGEPIGSTAEAELFPMPLPYPEVFQQRRIAGAEAVALKKFVVMAVIVLNYLHLNRPRSITSVLKPRQKLSKRQWEGVRRLESYARAWIEVSPIGPEEMGRTAAKVESLEEVISQLETEAATISDSNSYFGQATREDKEGDPQRQQGASSELQVPAGMTTFKEIDSKRLTFVGRPVFDPSPYLDPKGREIFQDPLATRDPITSATRRPPRLRVHCSKSEKVRLFELLDSTDRLAIHKANEVTPLFGSGLFAVTKSLSKDRMILDSRGANILEAPCGRWIRSLASAEVVCRYLLKENEELVCSGNDLKDFYYFFSASENRSKRNVLVGALHPKELSHLRALKPEHHQEETVFGALRTLAMGDCQAVELAQSCHLGLAISSNIVTAQNVIALPKPPPRDSTSVGLVIDDFVTLCRRPLGTGGRSEGAEKADAMLETYEDVGLMPNRDKSFRDELKTSFWGADVDGSRGHVRGSLKRALPLSNLILRIISVGYGTADLLQTVTGCIISLFLYRRRFLSVLDSIFDCYRGRGKREVVKLSGRVKTDLLIVATLLPLAVSNLRSAAPDRIYASDASSWGEAAVYADVPPMVGAELMRHSLRKSIWVKLLAPAAAWERTHGLLEAALEVPNEEDVYQSNPLWESLARCLKYKLSFAKAKQAPRHINIGEVRGALKAEKLGALRRPCSGLLVGLDSQVSLGALIKGRSASPALNAELARSLPCMVLLDYSADYFYYHTRFNPADDPTRGKEVRAPDLEMPEWWKDVERGSFESFDEWLRKFGLDDYSVSGLPDLDELRKKDDKNFTPGTLPGTSKPKVGSSSLVREGNAMKEELHSEGVHTEAVMSTEAEDVSVEERRSSSSSASTDAAERTEDDENLQETSAVGALLPVAISSRCDSGEGACLYDRCCPEAESLAEETEPVGGAERSFPGLTREAGGPGPFRGSEETFPGVTVIQGEPGPLRGSQEAEKQAEAKKKPVARETTSTSHRGGAESSRVAVSLPSEPAPPKVRSIRRKEGPKLSLQARRILESFPQDQFVLPTGCAWPPEEPGFLDLFSGERGVATEAAKFGVWSLCFDLEHGPAEDLQKEELQRRIEDGIKAGCFSSMGGGPVCSSFSMAITPPVRSAEWPYGKPNLSANMEMKVKEGNASALWMFSLLRLCLELKIQVWLENPAGSWMFRLPAWKALEADYPELKFWVVDYCRFGKEWRKRTRFATTSQLGNCKTLCAGGHQHRLLRGRCKEAKMSWTRVAQAYPRGVARSLAICHCMAVGAIEFRPFDPSSCARAGGMRIGEASHPGPRRPQFQQRTGLLADVPLVEAKTRVLQSKVWLGFSDWVANRLTPDAMASALSQPALLVLLLQEYGNCLYEEGKALYIYRHLVVLVQQSFQHAKPFMGPAWSMIAKWERLEPTTHRTPVPAALYKAVVTVSLIWGWRNFAAIVGIAFLGITRPSEALFALRKNLVLPADRLEPASTTAYLKIVKAKTSGRGNARVQHASVEDEAFVRFLETIFRERSRESRLNSCSSSAFRRRWDAILGSLEVPTNCGLTPGGLRGGGCVSAFQSGCDINRLLWKMRLRHQITLENYLQEVTASTLLASFPERARRRIHGASSLYELLLHRISSS